MGTRLGDEEPDSLRRTPESFGQGKQRRFYKTQVLDVPGPGKYSQRPAHGKQIASTKPTQPVHTVPRASRDGIADYVPCSPGPVHKPRNNAGVGRQVLSPRKTAPKFGFGTSSRFAKELFAEVPGPGFYSPCL